MAATHTQIFLTGATGKLLPYFHYIHYNVDFILIPGYIGGTILTRLLSHPKFNTFKITVLVRDQAKAKRLETLNITAEVGSHSDLARLEELASNADVVFAAANCDDLEAAQAINKGLKKRKEATGNLPILIHTSGTAVVCDDAAGMTGSEIIYSDANPIQIESLASTQPHREVDLSIVDAGIKGYLRSYIVLPSTVWGLASGPLVDMKLQNPHSQQIPGMIKIGLARGQGATIGQGRNLWPNVEINELGDLYMLLFDAALSNPSVPHGREGYYFGAADEHVLSDIYETVSKELYGNGVGKGVEPTLLTRDEAIKFFGNEWLATKVMGGNSRCRADQPRQLLGWKPEKGTSDMVDSIKAEVEVILARVHETT
ncbi:hypothetical protein JAAARDRAFT_293117 [Jaapia argillacea MUCL 33604]|uniref:Uncharacterized protein n=1 Tax=Jaapia argillacea MUCL 33604 TaxID=933084 RepID=A0A067PRB1_9AGAM|nr:hypothetical protein JAAARDRAFT_293117 [Jaapia argillacea MUCL 33604]